MLINAFNHQAEVRPDALALEYNGTRLSYGELLRRASAFAHVLHSRNIGSGARVAFALPKSIDAVVTLLGTLMTGAAYVPFNSAQPAERLARALTDCDAQALVATPLALEALYNVNSASFLEYRAVISNGPSSVSDCIAYDFDSEANPFRLAQAAPSDSPAYILYTSGTTGVPKGVVHSQLSACTFVEWAARTFDLGPHQTLANFALFSFDLSILDIFGALSTGASVHLVQPEMLLRPKELVRKLGEWKTTLLYAVPSAISLLESNGALAEFPPRQLKRILYAGEPFSLPQLQRAMRALPQATFYNLYGPTETNVCTYFELPPLLEQHASQVSIGRPCAHLQVALLDELGVPAKPDVEGELCVAGPSVMTEYFRQPELTRSAFFQGSLFADHQPRYRTGDRAVRDANGLLWFQGRRDRLVKRRGYRIELGEIESVLNQIPCVREAAVTSAGAAEETRIHAFVVPNEGAAPTGFTLKAACGKSLPAYMVPDAISMVSALPRTRNGKVDFVRLREMCTV